jgi:deoxyribodipyrimidine photolyase-related protein
VIGAEIKRNQLNLKLTEMKESFVFILFPHQLFSDLSLLRGADEVYLIEEFLFFNQYKFHKQKLVLHRASMKYYTDHLLKNQISVQYISAQTPESDILKLIEALHQKNIRRILFYDVCDDWLEKRINQSCRKFGIQTTEIASPLFINTQEDLKPYFASREKYFQTDFYIQQRKKLGLLMDLKGKPIGGKWSFDAENRLKYPKGKRPPKVQFPVANSFYMEAVDYVEKNYSDNHGIISEDVIYPVTHEQSEAWLQQFLEQRFSEFGEFEDAMVDNEHYLHHSILSPLMNIGLLLPIQVVDAAIYYAKNNHVSLNSLEGFIRQIIGWREFIRGVYIYKGTQERTQNYWNFSNSLPEFFYQANSGINPLDSTLKKIFKTGYAHHIERLMVTGNFMLLCEIHPDEVYRWYMEMFIDAYDWVMVPNVYGMSQFSDGGLMATKPYISGSNYLMKMSDFEKGEWQKIWDALFWRFMFIHRDFFLKNPRLGMLVRTFDKMDETKRNLHLKTAEDYLTGL